MVIRWIDFNRLAVYEAGALLVTLLAFPDASDETRRQRSRLALQLCAQDQKRDRGLNRGPCPQAIKPFYTLRSERDSIATCERSIALARSSGRWPHGDRLSQRGAHRPGCRRNKAALDKSIGRPRSRQHRIYRPSECRNPHLAAEPASRPSASAIQVYLTLREADIQPIGLEALLLNRAMIELVIQGAAYHETLMVQSRHLRFDPRN